MINKRANRLDYEFVYNNGNLRGVGETVKGVHYEVFACGGIYALLIEDDGTILSMEEITESEISSYVGVE